MNNNKKNQHLEMFLNIADELLENHHIKSRRDFSTRYLNRCSNLLVNLHKNKLLPQWQEQLSNSLYKRALKD